LAAQFTADCGVTGEARARLRGPAADRQWAHGVDLEALANLAHELRTPIQVLLGYLEVLRDEMADALGPRPRQVIDRIHVNAHDLAQTVENVMDFAVALGRGEAEVEEDLVLADLIAEVMPALEAANQSKQLNLVVDLDDAPPAVRSRHRPIRSILLNLALNAVKFTDRGTVRIAMRGCPSADHCATLELEVCDTGPGIAESRLREAFEPCTQLSSSSVRRYRGLGLGLAVVRRNVASLGATLQVQSAPNRGTTVNVSIPLRRQPASGPNAPRRNVRACGRRRERAARPAPSD
jgi:signal transduction histidine kinase